MVIADKQALSEKKAWNICRMPFWQSAAASSSASSSSNSNQLHPTGGGSASEGSIMPANAVSSVARSLLPTRRRLRFDPANKLYFPCRETSLHLSQTHTHKQFSSLFLFFWFVFPCCGDSNEFRFVLEDEPGKQVRSAVRIKNSSKSHVAFKFQTTAPKSCFMRPPGGILAPGETMVATVFKFVEHPENNEKVLDQKSKVKFKIVSLKVNAGIEYVPELFDEHKDLVSVEQILRVVFLDPERSSPQLDKLKHHLEEAEAALESRKKPPEDSGPKLVGEGLVIDEWKQRRERYLARQNVEDLDSV